MASNMWWFFDLTVLMLIAGFVFIGYTRTLGKTLILLAGCVVALSASLIVDSIIADAIYSSSIRDNLREGTENVINQYKTYEDAEKALEAAFPGLGLEPSEVSVVIDAGGEGIVDAFAELIAQKHNAYKDITPSQVNQALVGGYENSLFEMLRESVPSFAVRDFSAELSADNQKLSRVISAFAMKSVIADEKEIDSAEYLEASYFASSIVALIRIVAFLTLFFIILTLMKIISMSFQRLESFDIQKHPSMAAAIVYSIGEGLLVAFIVAVIVRGIIYAADDELIFLNEVTVGKTIIFKYIYNLNIV